MKDMNHVNNGNIRLSPEDAEVLATTRALDRLSEFEESALSAARERAGNTEVAATEDFVKRLGPIVAESVGSSDVPSASPHLRAAIEFELSSRLVGKVPLAEEPKAMRIWQKTAVRIGVVLLMVSVAFVLILPGVTKEKRIVRATSQRDPERFNTDVDEASEKRTGVEASVLPGIAADEALLGELQSEESRPASGVAEFRYQPPTNGVRESRHADPLSTSAPRTSGDSSETSDPLMLKEHEAEPAHLAKQLGNSRQAMSGSGTRGEVREGILGRGYGMSGNPGRAQLENAPGYYDERGRGGMGGASGMSGTPGGGMPGGGMPGPFFEKFERATLSEAIIDEERPVVDRYHSNEAYAAFQDNGFRLVKDKPLSTFSIDVDTASYANVRRFLNRNQLPPRDAVRIEEMLNYFTYDYPPPADNEPFSVNMEVGECPWRPEHRLLRVALKGRDIPRKKRPASNLVFLIDVSGSMQPPNKLDLIKTALKMLVEDLTENDRVSIVTYAGDAGLKLPPTNGTDRARITQVIDSLQAGGSTHGSAGIALAYDQAVAHFVEAGTNRVLLLTDGDLNVGVTRDEDLVQLIQQKAATGVFLTVLGVGDGNLKDSKMEKLADHGNGVYAYLDSVREARKVFIEQMSGSLVTIAKDVKFQVEFNPAVVQAYRLIGYENRVLANRDFHDDTKDAGEVGAGHTVTALYELIPAGGPIRGPEEEPLKYQKTTSSESKTTATEMSEMLTLKLRFKHPDANRSELRQFPLTDAGRKFSQTSLDFQFASSVAMFGQLLRNSQYRGEATLAAVEEMAVSSMGEDPKGYRIEFVDLVRKAQQIASQRSR